MKIALFALFLGATFAHAETPLPECQTEDSRAARYTAQGMAQAASESDPWAGCSSGCQMASSLADSMEITKRNFEAQSRASLYKARAMEAAKCPQYADQIMVGIAPLSASQKLAVFSDYQDALQKATERLAALKAWQAAHPQCKHVDWWISGGMCINNDCSDAKADYSTEDFSGHFKGKAGECSADGHGESWRGTGDDISRNDPDQNDLIGKVDCADALRKVKSFDGYYADPKFCQAVR